MGRKVRSPATQTGRTQHSEREMGKKNENTSQGGIHARGKRLRIISDYFGGKIPADGAPSLPLQIRIRIPGDSPSVIGDIAQFALIVAKRENEISVRITGR